MPPGATTPPRRSQSERSAATREALLDATIACLVEDGYANTTTTRVSERAGLSRGAHLHHFQTRATLMATAVERLAQRRTDELMRIAGELDPDGVDPGLGLDLMWETYSDPLFQALIDLWAHARNDPELRDALIKVERSADRQMFATAEKF